jgi:ABC-type polysaccharide/polyol phosphate export permease
LTRWVVMFAWAAGALAVGGLVFRKFSGRIVEEL